LEVITGIATAPSSTFTGLTMASGNSLTVRNARLDSKVWLLDAWAFNNVAGTLRVRSPKLHDNVQGIRLPVTASDATPLLHRGYPQRLIPQDTLIAELTGSAVGGQIETASLLLYYEDLPGQMARFIDIPTLMKAGVNDIGVSLAITTGVGGNYTGQRAVNADFDLFKANTDYALVGYQVSAAGGTVRWQGVDVGNLGIGAPCTVTSKHMTASWFLRLTHHFGIPLIPVFNSANRGGILVDVATSQAGTAVTVVSIFVELAPGMAPQAVITR
jgi:hypothetical protein